MCKNGKKLANLPMLSTKNKSLQIELFTGLADKLNQKHPLYLLANRVGWPFF